METQLTLVFLLVSFHLIQGAQSPPCGQQHPKHSNCNRRSYRSKNRRSMDFASSGDSMEDDEDLHDSKTIIHTPGRAFINTIYHSRTRSMLVNSLPASLQAHTATFQPTRRATGEIEGSGENTKDSRHLPMSFQWPIQGAKRYNHTYPDSTTEDPSIPENPIGLEDPTLLLQEWEEEPTVRISKANFRGSNGSQVNAQAGTTAHIPCTIVNRADHETVSWIRLRDHHLITVGRQTYSSDERFSVTFNRHKQEWTLHLRYAQHRDAGEYVCQLSTHPPMVFITTLTITQAEAEIPGGPDRYVQEGSVVKLTCKLRLHSQTPEYVFWYHNRTMINFDINRQVTVEKTTDGSILTLKSVVRADSGNYTCLPAKAKPASLMLHIILGDAPAAMQVSSTSSLHQRNECIFSLSNFTRFPLLAASGPFIHIPLLLILQVIAT